MNATHVLTHDNCAVNSRATTVHLDHCMITLADDDDGGGGLLCLSPADQLKLVMEQVLDFAVRELTKIVEASFDDLLLEITKMETEQQVLEERLGKSSDRGGRGGGGGAGGRRRGSENDSVSPSGSEDAREELAEVTVSKEAVDRRGE